MASDGGPKSVWRRRIIGKPARWQGVTWTAAGLFYFGLGFAETYQSWSWIAGGIWTVLGIVTLIVSFSDHRHGRGRYRRPEPTNS